MHFRCRLVCASTSYRQRDDVSVPYAQVCKSYSHRLLLSPFRINHCPSAFRPVVSSSLFSCASLIVPHCDLDVKDAPHGQYVALWGPPGWECPGSENVRTTFTDRRVAVALKKGVSTDVFLRGIINYYVRSRQQRHDWATVTPQILRGLCGPREGSILGVSFGGKGNRQRAMDDCKWRSTSIFRRLRHGSAWVSWFWRCRCSIVIVNLRLQNHNERLPLR